MSNEWIDKDTPHKVIRLTCSNGNNASFYFHNNPFAGNKGFPNVHLPPDGQWIICRASFEETPQVYAVFLAQQKGLSTSY